MIKKLTLPLVLSACGAQQTPTAKVEVSPLYSQPVRQVVVKDCFKVNSIASYSTEFVCVYLRDY